MTPYALEYERDAHFFSADHFPDTGASFRAEIRHSGDAWGTFWAGIERGRAQNERLRPARKAVWTKVCTDMVTRAAECRAEYLALCAKHGWKDDGRYSPRGEA